MSSPPPDAASSSNKPSSSSSSSSSTPLTNLGAWFRDSLSLTPPPPTSSASTSSQNMKALLRQLRLEVQGVAIGEVRVLVSAEGRALTAEDGITFDWYRSFSSNGDLRPIRVMPGWGASYQLSADDVGARICLRASLQNGERGGGNERPLSVFHEVGPFPLSKATAKRLAGCLEQHNRSNSSSSSVTFSSLMEPGNPRDVYDLVLSCNGVALWSRPNSSSSSSSSSSFPTASPSPPPTPTEAKNSKVLDVFSSSPSSSAGSSQYSPFSSSSMLSSSPSTSRDRTKISKSRAAAAAAAAVINEEKAQHRELLGQGPWSIQTKIALHPLSPDLVLIQLPLYFERQQQMPKEEGGEGEMDGSPSSPGEDLMLIRRLCVAAAEERNVLVLLWREWRKMGLSPEEEREVEDTSLLVGFEVEEEAGREGRGEAVVEQQELVSRGGEFNGEHSSPCGPPVDSAGPSPSSSSASSTAFSLEADVDKIHSSLYSLLLLLNQASTANTTTTMPPSSLPPLLPSLRARIHTLQEIFNRLQLHQEALKLKLVSNEMASSLARQENEELHKHIGLLQAEREKEKALLVRALAKRGGEVEAGERLLLEKEEELRDVKRHVLALLREREEVERKERRMEDEREDLRAAHATLGEAKNGDAAAAAPAAAQLIVTAAAVEQDEREKKTRTPPSTSNFSTPPRSVPMTTISDSSSTSSNSSSSRMLDQLPQPSISSLNPFSPNSLDMSTLLTRAETAEAQLQTLQEQLRNQETVAVQLQSQVKMSREELETEREHTAVLLSERNSLRHKSDSLVREISRVTPRLASLSLSLSRSQSQVDEEGRKGEVLLPPCSSRHPGHVLESLSEMESFMREHQQLQQQLEVYKQENKRLLAERGGGHGGRTSVAPRPPMLGRAHSASLDSSSSFPCSSTSSSLSSSVLGVSVGGMMGRKLSNRGRALFTQKREEGGEGGQGVSSGQASSGLQRRHGLDGVDALVLATGGGNGRSSNSSSNTTVHKTAPEMHRLLQGLTESLREKEEQLEVQKDFSKRLAGKLHKLEDKVQREGGIALPMDWDLEEREENRKGWVDV